MSAIGHNIVLQDLPTDICIIRQVDLWDNERSDNSKRCCCGPRILLGTERRLARWNRFGRL